MKMNESDYPESKCIACKDFCKNLSMQNLEKVQYHKRNYLFDFS